MIRYHVRSRKIVDLYGDINRSKIILSPHFQRNLVWREMHKREFIQTILLGYPFPQIFIAQGSLNIESLTSTSAIVDGQQRLNAIREFIEGLIIVDGKKFQDLDLTTKELFLNYEVPIIDLEISDKDPRVVEIFKRLNRTFYALTQIEKLSTEYASSEFMLVAKVLCDEIYLQNIDSEEAQKDLTADPNLSQQFVSWAKNQEMDDFHRFIFETNIFSKYEIQRMVHLMFTLNLVSTYIFGYYNRNDKVDEYINLKSDSFDEKTEIVDLFNRSSIIYESMNFDKSSAWFNKSSAFSLFIFICSNIDKIEENISEFCTAMNEIESYLSASYKLAAKEGVNNKKEREIRALEICKLIQSRVSYTVVTHRGDLV